MNALTADEIAGISEIMRLHDEALRDYLTRHDWGHKSSEGCVEVVFSDFWERGGWDNPGAPGRVKVGVYSYALGPNRMHYFDSVAQALDAVRGWHREQMERGDDE